MNNKDSDIFISGNKLNADEEFQDVFSSVDNPFMNISTKTASARHLNDYDSDILEEDAYKDIADDVFKLEYKISRTEKAIEIIKAQINALKEINDDSKIGELQTRLNALLKDHEMLLTVYNDKTLSAKITGYIAAFNKNLLGWFFSILKNIFDVFISRMPNKVSSVLKVKKSISALENINNSVDKLVKMSVPYGEKFNKYQQLSKYIIKANSIQAEISGYLNNK